MYQNRQNKSLNRWIWILIIISGFVLFFMLLSVKEGPILLEHSLKEWINDEASNVKQDGPQLVQYVRDNHIFPASKLPYTFNSDSANPSQGQLQSLLPFLREDPGGFFVEAGANDGEWGTNTLYLERHLGWNGLLIEASPLTFAKLLKKNRKAWHSNAALSTKPRPMLATFYENPEVSVYGGLTFRSYHRNNNEVEVQCVPLYTLLLAINRTEVDFLSLDLEGTELDVLRTIPFDKVNIKALAVEVLNGKEGPEPVKELMAKKGYHLHDILHDKDLGDLIFINEELYQLSKKSKDVLH